MNRTYWTPQVEALAPTNRILVVDLPGHGHLERTSVHTARRPWRWSGRRSNPSGVSDGPDSGGADRDRRPVARRLRRDGPGRRGARDRRCPRPGWLDGRADGTAAPTRSGPWPSPTTGPITVVDRLTAAFIRRRYPGGLGDLLVTSGFAYRVRSEALRSLAGEPFLPRLAAYPGTVVLVNGARDVAMRPGERRFLADPPRPPRQAARRLPPLEPRPAGGVHRGRSARRLRRPSPRQRRARRA